MSTLVPDDRHPALDVDEPQRVDYLTVVASMAYADHSVDESELLQVEKLCKHVGVSPESIDTVLAAAKAPDSVAIDAILERLRKSPLRFALIVDAIDIAYADNKLEPTEAAEIRALADKLGVSDSQTALISRYVSTRRENGDHSDSKLTTGLTAAGVPLAALLISSAVGAPLAAGAGIAAALGIGSYMSLRWLHRKATKPADQ